MGVTHLEQLVITNYDEDHASDLANLLRVVSIGTLVSNPSVSGDDIEHLKSIGGIGAGIQALADLKRRYTGGAGQGPDFGAISLKYYWNRYPREFEDENNLSLVAILTYGNFTICFPGDMEADGWRSLLGKPGFSDDIGRVNVFVASHHGRHNGCCDELFSKTQLYPEVTIISDAGVQYASQETIAWYRQRTRGITLNGEKRWVLTTRRDGRILLQSNSSGMTLTAGV